MNKVLIISSNRDKTKVLNQQLSRQGFSCLSSQMTSNLVDEGLQKKADIMILDNHANAFTMQADDLKAQLDQMKSVRRIPVLILIEASMVNVIEQLKEIDDFIMEPYNPTELAIRIRRCLNRISRNGTDEVLQHDDLIINMANCEVFSSGKLIALTFKEYELLKFLAVNKGRVYSREALLNEIWGFDYYGGDRTVDVHIRRLRSKIEDNTHSYVDTVRNIGYKFKENAKITGL
jgi:DNA-binding response OmpR family regulator